MGLGSRIAIGLFCVVCGAMCFGISTSQSSNAVVGMQVVGGYCFLIALACVGGKLGNVALRIVAITVFLGCCFYVFDQVTASQRVLVGKGRSDNSVVNSLLAFAAFGIPAGAFGFGGTPFLAKLIHWRVVPERSAFILTEVSGDELTERLRGEVVAGNYQLSEDAAKLLQPILDRQAVRSGEAPELSPISEAEARELLTAGLAFDPDTDERIMSDFEAREKLESTIAGLSESSGSTQSLVFYRVRIWDDEERGVLIASPTETMILWL